MDIEEIRAYCLHKKGATEGFPFGADALVFKVMGKMFLLISITAPNCSINVKCNPELAIQLREKYDDVQPGYHMNKKMWNTVTYNGEFSIQDFFEMIDHSYHEVVKKMTKKLQASLKDL